MGYFAGQLVPYLLLHLTWRSASGVGVFQDMGLPTDDLYIPGDLLLGGIFPLNRRAPGELCGGRISSIAIQGVQAMIYMIDQVNKDPDLLSNISLGYAIVNDCQTEKIALARSTQFLPVSNKWRDNAYSDGHEQGKQNVDGMQDVSQYRVLGVVGPYSSTFSVAVSPLFSFYHIPHISWIATSDQLTNEDRYPYFSRVVPTDHFQAKAIVDVIINFNWTYISALYSQGSYGSNGIKTVMEGARDAGICVAYSSELRGDFLDVDYDHVINELVKNYRARVVVLFIDSSYARKFMYAVGRANVQGEFIFVASEGFGAYVVNGLEHLALNILSLTIPGGPFISKNWGDVGFERYYRSLSPWNNATGSKWYGQYTPEDVGCNWEAGEKDANWCGRYTNVTDFSKFKVTNWPVRVMDCVKTFALALNATFNETCPEDLTNKTTFASCITGEALLRNIRKVDYLGYSTKVKFEENGDLKGSRYMVMAHSYINTTATYVFKGVGLWDYESRTLDINYTDLIWFEKINDAVLEVAKVPESICAKPCQPGQFLIQGELACCWECHSCPEDQVVHPNGKSCNFCEDTTWPDQQNFTVCLPIPPTYLLWTDPMAIGLVSINGLAFLIATISAALFIIKKDEKIIKGSSRELMAPILIGLLMGYIIVLTFIKKPTTWTCYIRYFGFHLSCSFIFVPLFLKTLRVYQIFQAAEKCRQKVRFGDIRSLLTLLLTIMLFQTGVTVAVCLLYPPNASLSMPIRRVRFVELSCQSSSHLIVLGPLTFNLLFILLTALFGFLTRHLPDNFNESWYIFISVTTTLVVWLAFLPTYFITFYAYHQAALLALALILNGAIISLCLFGPKFYAVYFVNKDHIRTSNFDSQSMHRSTYKKSDDNNQPSAVNAVNTQKDTRA